MLHNGRDPPPGTEKSDLIQEIVNPIKLGIAKLKTEMKEAKLSSFLENEPDCDIVSLLKLHDYDFYKLEAMIMKKGNTSIANFLSKTADDKEDNTCGKGSTDTTAQWPCPACTFLNSTKVNKCGMCDGIVYGFKYLLLKLILIF